MLSQEIILPPGTAALKHPGTKLCNQKSFLVSLCFDAVVLLRSGAFAPPHGCFFRFVRLGCGILSTPREHEIIKARNVPKHDDDFAQVIEMDRLRCNAMSLSLHSPSLAAETFPLDPRILRNHPALEEAIYKNEIRNGC